jgi:aerobic carbon-monoxide dehydrogenase medium subunit
LNEFDYLEPETLDDALTLLRDSGPDVHVLAGGTALVLMLKLGLIQPRRVVALRRIESLRGIRRREDGALEIGAMVTHGEIERSSLVRAYSPALAHAFGSIGTVRIRNQGTIGGNLVHADPAQDPPPMLIALAAEVDVATAGGVRVVPVEDLFLDTFETAVAPGEIVLRVRLPAHTEQPITRYTKFLPRTHDDYATISVAVAVWRDTEDIARDVRIGLGGAGPTPIRARSAEAVLRGRTLSEQAYTEAAEAIDADIDPFDDARGSAQYKRQMAAVWLRRTLTAIGTARDPREAHA